VGQLPAGKRLKPGLVVDTHAALWYLADDPALSARAATALDATTIAGQPIYLPGICVVETIYLAEKGRIPEAALERLLRALREPNPRFVIAPLDWDLAITVRSIARADVPDLPDRVIAATAAALQLPLVTKDGRIRATNLETIW
jgi:PIN domain nuclease of toxin-antitoxin system